MPLFGRPDGDLVRDEAPVRRIMPYLMVGRNESVVYQESLYRVAATRAWLRAYNRSHRRRATLFHLLAYGCATALHRKPRLNRFVSGGKIWQRRGVQVSFVAKQAMSETGADLTVKLEVPAEESFPTFSARLAAQVDGARGDEVRPVDREVALILRLPGPLVALLVGLARRLDRWNLFPWFMMKDDPMYASLFLANLGSVGVSDAYHHLFEYGTVSIFGVMSAVRRHPFADRDGVRSAEAVSVRWTFDERIDDAFSSARALAVVQRIMEDPASALGPPEGEPTAAFAAAGEA
jgi:2-oxoacid dehydrogenases acyltransferase (catalytic domain)